MGFNLRQVELVSIDVLRLVAVLIKKLLFIIKVEWNVPLLMFRFF